jgi:hypothetical protein
VRKAIELNPANKRMLQRNRNVESVYADLEFQKPVK